MMRRRNEARTTLLFFFTSGWETHLRNMPLSIISVCLCFSVWRQAVEDRTYPQQCAESCVTELRVLKDHWELQYDRVAGSLWRGRMYKFRTQKIQSFFLWQIKLDRTEILNWDCRKNKYAVNWRTLIFLLCKRTGWQVITCLETE